MNAQRLENIKKQLQEIEKLSNEYWMHSLSTRKKAELEFHDKHRDHSAVQQLDQDTYERFYGNKKYYSATNLSQRYVRNWIEREAKDSVFLDYCCGNGSSAIEAAKAGAALAIGIDISKVSVENAICYAKQKGVSHNTYFVQADAENTMLPCDSVDRIICSGVLHHLDRSYAFPELHRIVIPGGKILCHEALDYNPAIKLYRYLTPEMRTEWEKTHILSLKDIRFAKRFFKIGDVRFWHILGILAPHFPFLTNIFHSIDNVLTKIPLVKLMAWMFTFELIKPSN